MQHRILPDCSTLCKASHISTFNSLTVRYRELSCIKTLILFRRRICSDYQTLDEWVRTATTGWPVALRMSTITPLNCSFYGESEACFKEEILSHDRPTNDPSSINSRAQALLRRCESRHTALNHLATVLNPINSLKHDAITSDHFVDMKQEANNVVRAMHQVEAHIIEVGEILEEMERKKEQEAEKNRDKQGDVCISRHRFDCRGAGWMAHDHDFY